MPNHQSLLKCVTMFSSDIRSATCPSVKAIGADLIERERISKSGSKTHTRIYWVNN